MYFDYMLPDAILIYSLQYAMTFHITSVLSLAIHLFHKKLSYHRCSTATVGLSHTVIEINGDFSLNSPIFPAAWCT